MRPKRVLIADDDHALLCAMRTRLDAEGFEVVTAQDGYQALAIARSENPDVVVLDVNMPAGSGFSVRERLRAIDGLRDTPVVFITGEPADKVRREAVEHGISSILHKPVDGRDLLEKVRAAAGVWTRRRSIGFAG